MGRTQARKAGVPWNTVHRILSDFEDSCIIPQGNDTPNEITRINHKDIYNWVKIDMSCFIFNQATALIKFKVHLG